MHQHGQSCKDEVKTTSVSGSSTCNHLTSTSQLENSRRNILGSTRRTGHGLCRSRRIVQRRFSTQKISHTSTLERILDRTLGGEMVSLTDTTGDLLGSKLGFEFCVLVLLGFGLMKGRDVRVRSAAHAWWWSNRPRLTFWLPALTLNCISSPTVVVARSGPAALPFSAPNLRVKPTPISPPTPPPLASMLPRQTHLDQCFLSATA